MKTFRITIPEEGYEYVEAERFLFSQNETLLFFGEGHIVNGLDDGGTLIAAYAPGWWSDVREETENA